jgi:recombination protein RecR
MDGISPDQLEIDSLVMRVATGDIKEVILALGATMEGDTTGYYLYRRLAPYPDVKITQLARGVALGNEIEYTDELTLGRSLQNRTLFADSIKA